MYTNLKKLLESKEAVKLANKGLLKIALGSAVGRIGSFVLKNPVKAGFGGLTAYSGGSQMSGQAKGVVPSANQLFQNRTLNPTQSLTKDYR